LERRLGLRRIDTDELVANQFNITIAEIFARHGEARFRDAETNVLRGLVLDRPAIIVTGGGIVLREENVDLLRKLGRMVWLDGDADVLLERATRKGDRPLLQTQDPRRTFKLLLETRKPIYSGAADIRIDTSHLSHEQVADAILEQIPQQQHGP
jgi:shikimate kinase